MLNQIWAKAAGLAVAGFLLVGAQVPADPAVTRSSIVLSRFTAATLACGIKLANPPTLVVKTEPPFMFYQTSDNAVHMSLWQELPAPLQGFFIEWSKQGTLGLDPPAMFSEIFNSLLVAHELGHFLQAISGRLTGKDRTLDHWQAETEANEIAIAFWSIAPEDKAKIASRVANFERFLGALPSPVPPGADPHAYFEANYERLSSDPVAYGWYQGAFMRAAWTNDAKRDFCEWAKLNAPNHQPKKTPQLK